MSFARYATVSVASLLVLSLASPARADHRRPCPAIDGLLEELAGLEADASRAGHPHRRMRLQRRVEVIRAGLLDLRARGGRHVCADPAWAEPGRPAMFGPPSGAAMIATPPAPPVLDERAFGDLVRSVQAVPFDGERVAMITSVARDGFFTSDQAVRLVSLVAFSGNRVEAAAALYPAVVDPWNFHFVYGLIPFFGDRERLRERVDALRPRWPGALRPGA